VPFPQQHVQELEYFSFDLFTMLFKSSLLEQKQYNIDDSSSVSPSLLLLSQSILQNHYYNDPLLSSQLQLEVQQYIKSFVLSIGHNIQHYQKQYEI
jgi:hypothetical protein